MSICAKWQQLTIQSQSEKLQNKSQWPGQKKTNNINIKLIGSKKE